MWALVSPYIPTAKIAIIMATMSTDGDRVSKTRSPGLIEADFSCLTALVTRE